MRICPYCAEEIQDEAVKCKHCKSSVLPASFEKGFAEGIISSLKVLRYFTPLFTGLLGLLIAGPGLDLSVPAACGAGMFGFLAGIAIIVATNKSVILK